MQAALRLKTTALPGHRLEVATPELPEGLKVEGDRRLARTTGTPVHVGAGVSRIAATGASSIPDLGGVRAASPRGGQSASACRGVERRRPFGRPLQPTTG